MRRLALFFMLLLAAVSAKTRTPLVVTREGKPDFEVRQLEVICPGQTLKVQLEDDRVKLLAGKDVLVKVKRKKDGLELEDGAGTRLLRIKVHKGPSYKISDGQDKPVLTLETQGPQLLAQPEGKVSASLNGLDWSSGGRMHAHLEGDRQLQLGLCLALGSLTPAQRAALAVYIREVGI